MAAYGDGQQVRDWARSQGIELKPRGAVPARVRSQYYETFPDRKPAGYIDPLPGPDEDPDAYEDIGEIGADLWDEPGDAPATLTEAPRSFRAVPEDETPEDDAKPVTVDPGPAHARKSWRPRKDAGKTAPVRMTKAIRLDIHAKIEFALTVPGSIWAARDPACGGTFMQQVPATADAFTDIVLDSPDLVAFFTGPASGFMKWLNLGAALMPVGQMVMAHHVYHSIEISEPEDAQQPGYAPEYAA